MPRFISNGLCETINKNSFRKGIKGYPFFYILILFITLLSLDVLFRYMNYHVFLDADIIHILLFDLSWSIIIVFLILLLPRFIRKTLIISLVFFISLVSIGESISIDLFYSVSYLLNFDNTSEILPRYLDEFSLDNLYFLLPLLIFTLSIYKVRLRSSFKKRIIILLTGIFIILATSIYTSFPNYNNNVENNTNYDKFLFFEEMDLVASRLGVTTFTIRNLSDIFVKSKYNLDSDTNLLTQLESYLNKDKTKNAYSNILANKNLIMIQVDDLDYLALNDNVMPTLNRLKNEGLFFKNFYSTYPVENGDTEFAVQTSIVPTDKTSNMNNFLRNHFPDSMGHLFNELGYSSFTIFNELDKYNIKSNFYLNLGYSVLNTNDLSDEHNSSYQTVENSFKYYLNKSKFFVNYKLSNTKYTLDNPALEKYYQDFSDYDVDEKVKYYYAACKELDTTLDYLLLNLTMSKKINNTVIIVYGTHSSLFEDEKTQLENIVSSGLDLYKTPLIVWTPSINYMPIYEYTSPIDLLPTLANMFGLPANYDNFVGNDVFSENNTVYFKNRSWINEVGEYDKINQQFTIRDKKYITDFLEVYIKNTNEIIEQKFTFSRLILERNYFIQIKV